MQHTPMGLTVHCPWCCRGQTMADTTADIRVSCHCSICGRYYRIDFQTMRVNKIQPVKRKAVLANSK